MIVHRTLPWDGHVGVDEPGGALWFPRRLQGQGRHDNPDVYGCLYVTEDPVSAIAERLAPFRGSGRLVPALLEQAGHPLALASIELSGDAAVIDLDDPRTLVRERLRPSAVATRTRPTTQAYALAIYERHKPAALRWWSTLESGWANLTLFDRVAARHLAVAKVRPLSLDDAQVAAAADALGLTPGRG